MEGSLLGGWICGLDFVSTYGRIGLEQTGVACFRFGLHAVDTSWLGTIRGTSFVFGT